MVNKIVAVTLSILNNARYRVKVSHFDATGFWGEFSCFDKKARRWKSVNGRGLFLWHEIKSFKVTDRTALV